MSQKHQKLELRMERAALEDLSLKELASLAAEYGPGFEQALAQRKQENAAFSQRAEFTRELLSIKNRLEPRGAAANTRVRAPRTKWWLAGPSLAVAGLCVLFLLPGQREKIHQEISSPEKTRIKGASPRIRIHQKRNKEAKLIQPGTKLGKGDIIQLSYIADPHHQGVIISLDGQRAVTSHFPDQPNGGLDLAPHRFTPLSRSYELDDAPHFERFIFVFAKKGQAPPLSAKAVLRAAQDLAEAGSIDAMQTQALTLPASWKQFSFVIRKETGTDE